MRDQLEDGRWYRFRDNIRHASGFSFDCASLEDGIRWSVDVEVAFGVFDREWAVTDVVVLESMEKILFRGAM